MLITAWRADARGHLTTRRKVAMPQSPRRTNGRYSSTTLTTHGIQRLQHVKIPMAASLASGCVVVQHSGSLFAFRGPYNKDPDSAGELQVSLCSSISGICSESTAINLCAAQTQSHLTSNPIPSR